MVLEVVSLLPRDFAQKDFAVWPWFGRIVEGINDNIHHFTDYTLGLDIGVFVNDKKYLKERTASGCMPIYSGRT